MGHITEYYLGILFFINNNSSVGVFCQLLDDSLKQNNLFDDSSLHKVDLEGYLLLSPIVCACFCNLDERLQSVEGASRSPAAGLGVVFGVVVAVLIVLLVVVDVSCYFINGCGATASICMHVRHRGPTSKQKTMEEGDR